MKTNAPAKIHTFGKNRTLAKNHAFALGLMLPFGFGARMCAGRRLAEQEIYITIIKVCFNQFIV